MPILSHPRSAAHNYHLSKIRNFLRIDGTITEEAKKLNYLFIMFTNRCGSNFLAECISSSGKFNTASEFLNWDQVKTVSDIDYSLKTIQDYFSAIALCDSIDNMFCSKISCDHLVLLCASGIMSKIMQNSTFIFIERSDKIDQSISLGIAEKTQVWSSHWEDPFLPQPENEPLNLKIVFDAAHSIMEQNHIIESFLVDNAANSTKILYEDLVRNPTACLEKIEQKIGKPIPYHQQGVLIRKQVDQGKRANKKRIVSEIRRKIASQSAD